MLWGSIENELLLTLGHFYEQDPNHFMRLPKQTVDSSSARVALAELRNEGYVEEQIRGEVRLTPMGYKVYKRKPLPVA